MALPNIEVVGTVTEVFEEVQVNDTFSKREIWVMADEDTQYPQEIKIEFTQDKCALLNKYSADDKVVIDVNIRGKSFDDKKNPGERFNFTKLNGWRIKGVASGGNQTQAQQPATPSEASPPAGDGTDDLPF